MKGFVKALGFGAGIYAVALTFSLGVVYGIKAQKCADEEHETPGDKYMFDKIRFLDESVDQLREVYGG